MENHLSALCQLLFRGCFLRNTRERSWSDPVNSWEMTSWQTRYEFTACSTPMKRNKMDAHYPTMNRRALIYAPPSCQRPLNIGSRHDHRKRRQKTRRGPKAAAERALEEPKGFDNQAMATRWVNKNAICAFGGSSIKRFPN
jgi:hypothetical protein